MKSKLIVIEGLDGSGKGTQTDLINNKLKSMGMNVTRLSFPDYTHPSSTLIKMYLNGELGNNPSDVNAYAASSFYAVDRYASYLKFWKEKYQSGDIIICDRYVTSNAIYQMTKLEEKDWKLYLSWLYDYEYNKLGLPKPNLVIYLNVDIEFSQNLMAERYKGDESKKDIHEKNIDFLKKCYLTSKYVSYEDKWHVINCMDRDKIRLKEDINKEIMDKIKNIL